MVPGGQGGGEGQTGRLGLPHTHYMQNTIDNKDLLCSKGDAIQYSVMTYMGKEAFKKWMYVYV